MPSCIHLQMTPHLPPTSGSHRFLGSEQLQLTFASPITQGLTLDIYAYVEASLEITPTYIKKLTS